MSAPDFSIIINFHNMPREAPRTLHTLTRRYQRDIAGLDYEVIALDNGSTAPLSAELVQSFGPEFRYHFFPTQSPSPVDAINFAVSIARAPRLIIMIDGAHLLSPGILAGAAAAFRAFPNAFVATLGLHLGPGIQNVTVLQGYNQQAEDALLAQVPWQQDGYLLFQTPCSTADASLGWFGALFESNCFAISREQFLRLGGFHPGFTSRGGGLVNLDFFRNAVESPELAYVLLLGEATFHQYHGGITSNVARAAHPWEEFHQEYTRLRGKPYVRPTRFPIMLGALRPQTIPLAAKSAELGFRWHLQPK